MFENELRFYREIAPEVGIRVPECWPAFTDDGRQSYWVRASCDSVPTPATGTHTERSRLMIEVARADQLGEGQRRRVTEVLVRGFAEDFSFFSADPAVLANTFEHMILLDRFYVACVDGDPAAIASFTSGTEQCFAPRWRPFRRHLGLRHGTICYFVVRSQFMKISEGVTDGVAEIGFVTTAPEYQGQGVATALMRHLVSMPGPRAFVLEEIKNTNVPALGLYEKLGFAVYRRRPEKHAARAGFDEYISMRLDVA